MTFQITKLFRIEITRRTDLEGDGLAPAPRKAQAAAAAVALLEETTATKVSSKALRAAVEGRMSFKVTKDVWKEAMREVVARLPEIGFEVRGRSVVRVSPFDA